MALEDLGHLQDAPFVKDKPQLIPKDAKQAGAAMMHIVGDGGIQVSGQDKNWIVNGDPLQKQINDIISRLNAATGTAKTPLHPYTVVDASTGSNFKYNVTPGNHMEVASNITWIPTLGGTALDNTTPPVGVDISGAGTWYIMFELTFDATTNLLSSITVAAYSSRQVGNGTTTAYQLIDEVVAALTAGVASVTPLNMGVWDSQDFLVCSGALILWS